MYCFANVCRICKISTSDNFIDINTSDDEITISEVITFCIPEISGSQLNTIIKNVCSQCYDLLTKFYKHKYFCLQSDQQFLKYKMQLMKTNSSNIHNKNQENGKLLVRLNHIVKNEPIDIESNIVVDKMITEDIKLECSTEDSYKISTTENYNISHNNSNKQINSINNSMQQASFSAVLNKKNNISISNTETHIVNDNLEISNFNNSHIAQNNNNLTILKLRNKIIKPKINTLNMINQKNTNKKLISHLLKCKKEQQNSNLDLQNKNSLCTTAINNENELISKDIQNMAIESHLNYDNENMHVNNHQRINNNIQHISNKGLIENLERQTIFNDNTSINIKPIIKIENKVEDNNNNIKLEKVEKTSINNNNSNIINDTTSLKIKNCNSENSVVESESDEQQNLINMEIIYNNIDYINTNTEIYESDNGHTDNITKYMEISEIISSDEEELNLVDSIDGPSTSGLRIGRRFEQTCPTINNQIQQNNDLTTHVENAIINVINETLMMPTNEIRNENVDNSTNNVTEEQELELYRVITNSDGSIIYKCKTCSQKFRYVGSIVSHVRRHIKPPHYCPYCDKVFMYQTAFKKHMDKHTIQKYTCQHCPEAFRTFVNYKSHVVLNHSDARFRCDKCSKTFKSVDSWKAHVPSHNDISRISYPCSNCNTVFRTLRRLEEHILTHTYEM